MRRFALSSLVVLVAVLVLVLPVQSAVHWCRTDPIVALNGTLVDIQVAVPLDYVLMVNGPVRIEIQTPKTTVRQLILTDIGFNGHGEEVIFTDGAGVVQDNQIPTKITVRVPIDGSQLATDEVVPVQVTVMPDNAAPVTVEGTSDVTKVQLTIVGH